MIAERTQWESLDQHQASLMIGRVVAASECVFGKAAQQAGIGLLNGSRYPVSIGEDMYDSVNWPDSTIARTTCYMVSNGDRDNKGPLGFVRVTEHYAEPAYVTEGVALNMAGRSGAALYGSGVRLYETLGNDTSAPAAGLQFFGKAMAAARQREQALRLAQPHQVATAMGVRGEKIGSLVSSLMTLDSNLIFGLSINEHGRLSDKTYDQAQAMMKKIISDSTAPVTTESAISATILPGPNGQPSGALFASDEFGLMAIRRINTYPQTIALTIAPPITSGIGASTVEHYLIQSRGVYMSFNVLDEENYTGHGLQSLLPLLDRALTEDVANRINLRAEDLDALDRKMINVLSGRIFQPVW